MGKKEKEERTSEGPFVSGFSLNILTFPLLLFSLLSPAQKGGKKSFQFKHWVVQIFGEVKGSRGG